MRSIFLITTFLLLFPPDENFPTTLPSSACWKRGVKSKINSYGAYGAGDLKACASLLLRESKYFSATVNTNTSICYLSRSVQFVTEVEATNWYASKACLVADGNVILGKFHIYFKCFGIFHTFSLI